MTISTVKLILYTANGGIVMHKIRHLFILALLACAPLGASIEQLAITLHQSFEDRPINWDSAEQLLLQEKQKAEPLYSRSLQLLAHWHNFPAKEGEVEMLSRLAQEAGYRADAKTRW
jgi:hypothetical protein